MGKIWTLAAARRLGIGVLAAGLLAGMAPTTIAAAKSAARSTDPVPNRFNFAAVARARAASAAHTARAASRTGVLSGVVHSAAGSPLGGACVTASGTGNRVSARTGPDGRYLLGGLRPGQYRISVGACGIASHVTGHESISVYWTSGPTSALVRAGQVSDLAPLSAWHLDLSSLAGATHGALAESAVTTKTGSISGTVTGNGRPLRGVCAVAIGTSPDGREAIVLTGKTGRYRITRLRPGRYDVVFVTGVRPCPNNGDWLPQWYPGVNSLMPTGKVKAVRVRAGKDTGGIDGHLAKGGQISGTVRTKSGKPLSGICVNVTGDFQRESLIVEYTLATNKRGQYALGGLFPAGYQAEFTIGCGTKGNYASQWWPNKPSEAGARTIRITGTKHVANINAAMLPGASVSGIVKAVNAAGKPVANVCVFALDANGDSGFGAITDHQGRYQLLGLSAGRFGLQFDPTCITGNSIYQFAQRNIRLTAGQTVTGFNVFLPVGGGISGVVTDAHGQPAGGVCVQINDDNGEITRTRPNGHYSLIGVENGSFQVMFFGGCGNAGSVAPQFYPNSPTGLFAKLIKFKPNTVTPAVDATMQPGGAIAGLVTDTAGHRLSRICVSTTSTELQQQTSIQTGSATSRAGKYQIENLAPGAYDLTFACGGYGPEFFPSQVAESNAGLVAVNPGATTTIPVTRLGRAGAITGTVTGPNGKAFPFACVQADPVADKSGLFAAGFTTTAPNGHYRLGGLAPARYRIQFGDCSQAAKLGTQWYRRQSAVAAATAVRVFPGRTVAGINAAMRPGGSITGVVTRPTGKPANAMCVFAISSQADAGAFSQTGESGRFRFTGLATGRWTISVTPCFSPKPDVASTTRPGTVRVVAPRAVTGVNVKLTRAGSVSGRVTSLVGGKALGEVCVLLVGAKGTDGFGSTLADGHGRYVVPHLAAGSYHAYIGDPGCDGSSEFVAPFAPQWFSGQPTQTKATAVHVSAGAQTTGINVALTSFGTITGTVTTRSHAAVAGECVTAVPFRDPVDPVTDLPVPAEVAVTGRTGAYTLTSLGAGRYKIEFSTGCGATGFATQWWDNAGSAASAKVISVGFATVTGIDATVRR